MITKQQFFEETIQYLYNQPDRCTDGSVCLYYDEDTDNRCAIGYWFTRMELPEEATEFFGDVEDLINEYPQVGEFIPSESLAHQLQSLHDDEGYRTYRGSLSSLGIKQAKVIAKEFRLTMPKLEKTDEK